MTTFSDDQSRYEETIGEEVVLEGCVQIQEEDLEEYKRMDIMIGEILDTDPSGEIYFILKKNGLI